MDFDYRGYSILLANTGTLKEASYDSEHGEYMTMLETPEVVLFDDASDSYAAHCGISSKCSVDALHNPCADALFLIEFKNGAITKAERYAIYRKIYDSLLILSDITGLKLSDYRLHADFILVFNRGKNQDADARLVSISSSRALNGFADTLAYKAGKRMIYFGLEPFQGYCFRKVFTLDADHFNAMHDMLFRRAVP